MQTSDDINEPIVVTLPNDWQKRRTILVRLLRAFTLPVAVWVWLSRLAWVGTSLFLLALALIQWGLFPRLETYHAEIEQAVSRAIGQGVRVSQLGGRWHGINPGISLDDLVLVDGQGRPALMLKRVVAVFSWQSLWRGQPELDVLVVDAPVLHVRRESDGRIQVAGFETPDNDGAVAFEWLMSQRAIRVQQARVIWYDQMRHAPPLDLRDVNVSLDNRGSHHRFGFLAQPPQALASRLDIRGVWSGETGELFAELASADLSAWRSWLDYPIELPRGRGGVRLWAKRSEGVTALTADLGLSQVRVRLASALPELDIRSLKGRVRWQHSPHGGKVSTEGLEVTLSSGLKIPDTRFSADWENEGGRLTAHAKANQLDLSQLRQLSGYLPLPDAIRKGLDEMAPTGRLRDFEGHWQQTGDQVSRYGVRASVQNLGMSAVEGRPGFQHLTGRIDGNQAGGEIVLDAPGLDLQWPSVFPDSGWTFDILSGRLRWSRQGSRWSVETHDISFNNPDLAGTLKGSYKQDASGERWADLQGTISRADARAVWRYIPGQVGEEVRHWVRNAIKGGKASHGEWVLKGDLRRFPFHTPDDGLFRMTAQMEGGSLQYADAWPEMTDIRGKLRFEQLGMSIEADMAITDGATLKGIKASIPDLETFDEQLVLEGHAESATRDFLAFMTHSPVSGWLDHLTRDFQASGSGHLKLKLQLPIRHLEDSRVQGSFQVQDNAVTPVPGLPPVQGVNGQITFTEKGLSIPRLDGQWLGQPFWVRGGGVGNQHFTVTGGMDVQQLRSALPPSSPSRPWLSALGGIFHWKADIRTQGGKVKGWELSSDLTGLSSSLPSPLNKVAARRLPLTFSSTALPRRGKNPVSRVSWQLRSDRVLNGQWVFREQGDERVFERGVLGVGSVMPKLPETGLSLAIKWPEFHLEEWISLLSERSGTDSPGAFPLSPDRLSLETERFFLMSRFLERLSIQGTRQEEGWLLSAASPDMQGQLVWKPEGRGSLRADLRRLYLKSTEPGAEGKKLTPSVDRGLLQNLPALDIRVGDLTLDKRLLGHLELMAYNDGTLWRIPRMLLVSPEGRLSAQVNWQIPGNTGKAALPEETAINFQWDIADAGRLLGGFGYPGLMKRGAGQINGKLAWLGHPAQPHYPSLSGNFRLQLGTGQFAKIESGTGRLIGLLSLQALPRRFFLDFDDVFSEGFAFDSIEGDLQVSKGVLLMNDPLRIEGAAAQVLMQGSTRLDNETQQLLLTIRPKLGNVASLGAAVAVNPVVGITSLIAQKLLQNPLDRVFSYQYRVTGTWDDPVVNKGGE